MPDRNAHRAVADAVARLHGAGGDGVAAHHAVIEELLMTGVVHS